MNTRQAIPPSRNSERCLDRFGIAAETGVGTELCLRPGGPAAYARASTLGARPGAGRARRAYCRRAAP